MKVKDSTFLFFVSLCVATSGQSQNLPPRIAQALRVLPPDSETLAVEQSAHLVPAVPKKPSDRILPLDLSNLQFAVISPYLPGRTIELSMEARSRFRSPNGFGLMPYDGCGLIYLKPQTSATRSSLERKLLSAAKQSINIGGQKIGIYQEKREQDIWRIYVTVPQNNLVVLATDRHSLETTLSRLKTGAKLRDHAFPASWSGWKWVDTRASFWAIRRLDLPKSAGIMDRDKKDKSAKAFVVFSRGDEKTPSFVMRYEGDTKKARGLFQAIQRELPGQFQVLPKSSVAQFTVADGNNGYFSYYALGLLGTGIYL